MNETEVIALMETSKSTAEWNTNVAEVKRRCGDYPQFWYPTMMLSGRFDKISSKFQ